MSYLDYWDPKAEATEIEHKLTQVLAALWY